MDNKLFDLIKKYSSQTPITFSNYLLHRHRDAENYPQPFRNNIKHGYVVLADSEAIERMIFAKSFRELGYETFIVELPRENEYGRIAIAPLKNDLEAILWIQSGYDHDEMMPFEIVKTLGEWRDYCIFRLTGAGINWVKLEFENLPSDILAFSLLISEFCPDVMTGMIKHQEDLAEHLLNERSILMRWRSNF